MFWTDVILNEPWRLKRESFEEKSVHKEELGERRKGRKSGVRRKEQYYNEKRQIRELQGREMKETGRVMESDQGEEKEWKSNVRLFGKI